MIPSYQPFSREIEVLALNADSPTSPPPPPQAPVRFSSNSPNADPIRSEANFDPTPAIPPLPAQVLNLFSCRITHR